MTAACWAAEPVLTPEKGDHVSLIGNTLADRMQHYGWMETLITARLPEKDLVFRDLGYSGDEVAHRERVDGFGSPDEWLARCRTDVVLAFFGFNESFGGPAGLAKFKADLDKFCKDTLKQKYNGKSAPRLVLISPIAQEDLHNPDLTTAAANNKNIKLYADAMAEVAKANGVGFVDLFTPSQVLYAKPHEPYTVNGVHLNERGDQAIAPLIVDALLGEGKPKLETAALEALRQAINDKNFYFFERYRTLDGYNVYGGRSYLKYAQEGDDVKSRKGKSRYAEGISNREVLQREMEVLDVMAANRDKRVWAVAQGKDLALDDSNTPPFIDVKTNHPGTGPNGTHVFLGGEEEIGHMKVHKGMKVNLFASEEQFPDLINPVQMAWDTKGRLWVTTWPTYPHWKPKTEMNDKLLILEDTDGDGKADKATVFADHLHCPTGFEFYNGGVIVAQAPGIVFLKDTSGGDHANYSERLIEGIDSGDTHHTANSFTFDPGGALYFQEGVFHHSQVETLWGPQRNINGGVFRFEPRSYRFEMYTSYGFANPHGHVWDKWGTDVVIDGTGAVPYFGPSFSGKTYFPEKHNHAPTVYKQRTRPCPGAEILSSRQFPDELQGNMLVANVIGFQGILNYKLTEKGSGLVGTEEEPILSSDDPNFRPADIEIGPDGAIYFTDWHNPIIGHMQHHLRDPNRDKTHGRVYRVTYEGRELLKPAKIAGEPVEKLLDLLKQPENRVRYRAKIELSARDTKEVIPAVEKWTAALDKNDPNYQHSLMEALWMYQWNNVVNEPLLKQMLRSPDYHARAAATRVLCYWRDRVPGVLDLLKVQANDESPRVRLEAVRACSFFTTSQAAEVALESVNHEQDAFLKYALDETMKTLDKHAK
jgi:glucose/arabinose dehydrogenase